MLCISVCRQTWKIEKIFSTLKNALLLTILSGAFQSFTVLPSSATSQFCGNNALEKAHCERAAEILTRQLLTEAETKSDTQASKAAEKQARPVDVKAPDGLALQRVLKPQVVTTLEITEPAGDTSLATSTVSKNPVIARSKVPASLDRDEITLIPFPTPRAKTPKSKSALKNNTKIVQNTLLKAGKDKKSKLFRFAGSKSANSDCLDPSVIRETDIASQRRILESGDFCITEQTLTEGRFNWKFYIIKNTRRSSGPLFVVLHDNENTSFKTGVYGVGKYGGTLVAIENREQRLLNGQDPNRNFGVSQRDVQLCKLQSTPAPQFVKAIMQHRKRRQPVIALHNNLNGWSGNGGQGTISVKKRAKGVFPFASAVATSRRLKDEDNAVVLTSTKLPGENRKLFKAKEFLTKKAGANVIYYHMKRDRYDCSFGEYMALNRQRAYFNVEAEHGDLKSQKALLDHVMDFVR